MRLRNHGKRWTEEDVVQLLSAWSEDTSLIRLAEIAGRTGGGVCGKLKDIGFLSMDTRTYAWMRNKTKMPYATMSEVKAVDRYMQSTDPNAPWSEFFQTVPTWKQEANRLVYVKESNLGVAGSKATNLRKTGVEIRAYTKPHQEIITSAFVTMNLEGMI